MHEEEDDEDDDVRVHDVKQVGVEGGIFRRQVKDVIIYDYIPFSFL